MNQQSAAPDDLNHALARQRERTDRRAVETITAANEQLQQSGIAPGLDIGETAPDFHLPDATGRTVTLSERLSSGPVVLTFYRGEWCPYCNLTLAALQGRLSEIKELGASLMAISPQKPDQAMTVTERHGLEFDVLSDIDQKVIKAYKLQFRVPADIEDIHLNTFKKDVSEFNADGSWNLPVPATLVVDRHGIIRARHVDAEYTRRMNPSEIIEALRKAQD